MSSLKKNQLVPTTVIGIISGVLFLVSVFLTKNNHPRRIKSVGALIMCLSLLLYLLAIFFFFKAILFNEKYRFVKDTILIVIYYTGLLCPVIFVLLVMFPATEKIGFASTKYSTLATVFMIFLISVYCWILYLEGCKKIIVEINKDVLLFSVKIIWSMASTALVFFSVALLIWLFEEKDTILTLIYQVINVLINSISPFVEMFIHVREELNKYIENDVIIYK